MIVNTKRFWSFVWEGVHSWMQLPGNVFNKPAQLHEFYSLYDTVTTVSCLLETAMCCDRNTVCSYANTSWLDTGATYTTNHTLSKTTKVTQELNTNSSQDPSASVFCFVPN